MQCWYPPVVPINVSTIVINAASPAAVLIIGSGGVDTVASGSFIVEAGTVNLAAEFRLRPVTDCEGQCFFLLKIKKLKCDVPMQ